MNFHDWILKDPTGRARSLLISLVLPIFRYLPPFSTRLANALMCERFVSGFPHIGPRETSFNLETIAEKARQLNERMNFERLLLGGNALEQEEFTRNYNPPNLYRLPARTNTPEQIKALLANLAESDICGVLILANETVCARAVLTCIKQIRERSGSLATLKIYPYPVIDPNRALMSQKLKELITIYEAFRLVRYQRKGDVASLKEGFAYLSKLRGQPLEQITTLCVIF